MSFRHGSCSNSYEVIDTRTGDYVCSGCGFVIDRYYEIIPTTQNDQRDYGEVEGYLHEILEKLNLPKYIAAYVKLNMKDRANKEKHIINELYRVLPQLNIPFSRKDLEAVSGIESKIIYAAAPKNVDNMVVISVKDVLERYCRKLNLNFEEYSLIKKSIPDKNYGFNPATVASAYIYIYCKKNKKKIKLKEISEVTGVTCMSVHRFMRKNDLSCRTKNSKG